MKKILLVAVMAMMGLQMQAQLVTSTSQMKKTEVVEVRETRNAYSNWNTLAFEYLPTSFKPDGLGYDKSATMHGFAFTWMSAVNLTPSIPLYIEPGIGLEFLHSTKELNKKVDLIYNMFSVKIPLNLIYDFQIPNTRVHIAPYFGFRFRINTIGEFNFDGLNTSKDKYNAFSKDDMGDDAFKRFQFGWQLGCKFRFSKFYLQAGWGTDFNQLSKKNTLSEGQFAIGVAF
ncbi:MAG: outer membrane beta-barrel protein [Prevotella sp.]|nr:outer membrane beta-barrel protein [Prevotella sp.]MBP3789415.1 outer membrane beta-barrel protein [Prevotella sp.]